MQYWKARRALLPVIPLLGLLAGNSTAQIQNPNRLVDIGTGLNQTKQTLLQLPTPLRRALSGGALNMLEATQHWQDIQQGYGDAEPNALARYVAAKNTNNLLSLSGVTPVSNPSTDFLFSVMTGFTQSETSTAWCGNSVVVGFNDSGSFLQSALFGPGGLSFSGAAYSTNGGHSFIDIGYINPGPNLLNFLGGDPVVNCVDSKTFYYSQIFTTGTLTPFAPKAAIAVSKSTDGGATWADPVAAVQKDAFTHFLDKDWSAVDPTNPNNIYVTYTDFDITGNICGFSSGTAIERVAIELVRSTDGGITWSAPVVLDHVCSAYPEFPFVQGAQVVVGPHGGVYVEWEFFPTSFGGPVREFRISRSFANGASFQPFVKIADAAPTGDGFALQGLMRTWLTGNLAIDRSTTASAGTLYFIWEDGRRLRAPDLESPTGSYGYANVLLSRSNDGAKTWSAPVQVNNDFTVFLGRGVDHFQPGVGVDSKGVVGACWYDRRDDPLNYLVSRFCGTSSDRGSTWTNSQVPMSPWPPIHATDAFVNPYYLGDYDTVVGDFLRMSPGLLGAFGNVATQGVFAPVYVPNQDVFLNSVP
jgi:hypothetical protein